MKISFIAYSGTTGAPLPGLSPTFVYFKRRNADVSFTNLAASIVDRGLGNYEFEIDDADLLPGSIVSYIIDLGLTAAARYEFSHIPADAASKNVTTFFLFSATTGDPTSGISCLFNYYKRRNADDSLTDLSGSEPAILDRGNLLFEFTVPDAQRPVNTTILYIIDATVDSAARYIDGAVTDPETLPLAVSVSPAPQKPKQTFATGISFSADQYARQLRELLPRGAAFSPDDESDVQATLEALAQELARVDARGVDLINESDPRTADETIADWERMLKLPDDRVTAIPGTLAERRIAVTQKYAARGGQNVDFFVRLCALCGWTLAGGSLARPAAAFGLQNTAGGTLHHGVTVAYKVTAYNFQGETDATEITKVITGVTNTNQQQITWNAVPGARGYRIYGRAAGVEGLMGHVIDDGSTTYGFVDTGSIAIGGAPPVTNTATYPAIEKFATRVARTGPTRCGDPLDGAAWAYTQRLNLQPPVGTVLNQASFERVVRHATHSHIVDVFVYH